VSGKLGEPGPELRWKNRRAIAKRTGWPVGAVETCERLDGEHPGWMVWWMPANAIKGWESPPGYCANRGDHSLPGGDELRREPEGGVSRHLRVFAEDPAGLAQRIEAMMERVAEDQERERRLWHSMRGFG
jgi:hypothetical protein